MARRRQEAVGWPPDSHGLAARSCGTAMGQGAEIVLQQLDTQS